MEKIIEMKNIKKLFPGVVALDDITFDLYPGEVHVPVSYTHLASMHQFPVGLVKRAEKLPVFCIAGCSL